MIVINATNVNDAYYKCMIQFRRHMYSNEVIELSTRGERRVKLAVPVSTLYKYPRERVLFDETRDANPFFHFMEALWILAGRNDVTWLSQWLAKISEFTDDGETFYGAYGARIFKDRQLYKVMERLRLDRASSRAVVAIYEPADVNYSGKDLPCNCTIFLGIDHDRLNITVANRSNDMIWGAYGANVVQFSTLQEYIAFNVDAKMGWYCQMSNNAHIYPDHEVTKRVLGDIQQPEDLYDPYCATPALRPYDMFTECQDPARWDLDLQYFMDGSFDKLVYPYFKNVAVPMAEAHSFYRNDFLKPALELCDDIVAEDWRIACKVWLQRRINRRKVA